MFFRERLEDFVANKRVALVGPANYLTSFRFGGIIDEYDVVVRVNRGMELTQSMGDHVGTRTDILYNCLVEHPDNGGEINVNFLRDEGVKWVCTVPNSDATGLVKSPKLHPQVKWLTVAKLKWKLNFHVFDFKNYGSLNASINCRANTGFAAIFDLLNCGVRELHLTGFSFYLDSFIDGYKQGCERDEKQFAEECFRSIRHNQQNQWQFLKDFSEDQRLTTDPILSEILSLSDLDRDKFPAIIEKLLLEKL